MPLAIPSTTSCRHLAFACAFACTLACRPAASPTPPQPEPTAAPAATKPAAAPRMRAPEEVVAVVDGVVIREADVDRLARVASTSPGTPTPPREALVLQLVERQLVANGAAALSIAESPEDVDRALVDVAASNGMTPEQLRAAVESETPLSWAEYRQEIAAQILEMRLLMATQPWAGEPRWLAPSPIFDGERMAATRARMIGCMRARAKVSVEDATVELPENPFAIAATLAHVRFTGDTGVPAADLELAAKTAGAGKPLCDSLAAAELAMSELYLERGYLDAKVRIPWPESPGTTTVDVETVPGPRHVIGEIAVDQTAVPKAKRVKDKALRKQIAAKGKTGDVASLSRLQAIVDAVEGTLRDAGVGPVEVQAERKPGAAGEDVRLDLVLRAGANAA